MSRVMSAVTRDYPFAYAGQRPIMDPKERFYRQFQLQVADIHDHISRLSSVAIIGGERKDATDSILASISRLSLEVSDAADYIPAYDQRTYSDAVKNLTEQLNEELARLAPKSRFQFKRTAKPAAGEPAAAAAEKKDDPRLLRGTIVQAAPVPALSAATAKPTAGSSSQAREAAVAAEKQDAVGDLPSFNNTGTKNYNAEMKRPAAEGGTVRKPSFSTAQEVAISGHQGLHIVLPLSASRATASGSLTDLRGCVVDMSVPTASTQRGGGGAAFLSLALKNLERSLVVAGHVSGSVHITGLRDCVVVVAARQVRIHECANVDVYLWCGSRPIVEDCRAMRFAPLPALHLNDEDPAANQWDQVDDFKWLKAEPSPNWAVLPEAERVPEAVWTKVVADGQGLVTEDLLKAVGISKR